MSTSTTSTTTPVLTNIKVTMYLSVASDSTATATSHVKNAIGGYLFAGGNSIESVDGTIITNEFTAYEITNQG